MFIIVADQIRPIENIIGIILILHRTGRKATVLTKSKDLKKVISLAVGFAHMTELEFVDVIKTQQIIGKKKVFIFGGQLNLGYGRLVNFIFNNFVFVTVFFPPGIVDKPIGIKKFRVTLIRKLKYILRKGFIWLTRRVYVTTSLKAYESYYAANNYFPKKNLLNIELPKHIAMKHTISKNAGSSKPSVRLYAPTHDTAGEKNELLMRILANRNQIDNFKISIHPQDREKYAVPLQIQFNGDWSKVSNVFSDNSSIGLDFSYVTGLPSYRELPENRAYTKNEIFGIPVVYCSFEKFLTVSASSKNKVTSIETDLEQWEKGLLNR